ncbi:MAG: hypothetical protein JWO86_6138 [Myxococcaceae bacterium]|nr:hypothetical protein [Myxococcaceae bacterium]MEA2750288.1 hypothetical protein [Myxococcales bacterium]
MAYGGLKDVYSRGVKLRVRCIAFVLAAGVMAAAGRAHADPSEGGAAAAESLFQEARKLMDAKRYSEACPKLVASQKIAPAVGTLLNLADCYEKAGQLASAWARFHEAIALAQRLGRADREKTAKERADKLEPRLIKLTIVSQEKDVEVKLDGNVLDAAALGTAVPVDPGKHGIEATAKGKKAFTTTVDVSDRARSPSVEIPPLDVDPEATKEKGGGSSRSSSASTKGVEEESNSGSTQRIVSYAALGLGAVGIGIGAIFGLRTGSIWNDAKTHCTGLECDRTGVTLATDAKNAGTVSTISFIAGGVLLAGGAALFFTAPSGSTSKPSSSGKHGDVDVRVGVGLGSMTLQGRF